MRLNPFKRKSRRRRSAAAVQREEGWLSPQAKRTISGIVVLVFSLIAILGLFNGAGPTGDAIVGGLRRVFGWLAYIVPFGLAWWALHLVWPSRIAMERLRVIGIALTAVGLLGLLHILGASSDDALQAAHDGKAGGYLGFVLSFPLSQAVSRIAALMIFIGTFLIGMILTFRVSPADLWNWIKEAFSSSAEEGEEGAEEADEEAEPSPNFRVNMMRGEKEGEGEQRKQAVQARQVRAKNRRYKPGIIELLQPAGKTTARNTEWEKKNNETIRRTLEHFGIGVEMGETHVGPTVTQYTLRPEEGAKLARITALQNDLALALAAHPIRIEAPIPNTNLVGIEIPNKAPSLVRLRDLLLSKEFKEADSPLTFVLGKDVTGRTVVDTLERLPHMLIAGATGAGKSVNIHTLMVSWLYRNSPEVVKFILIDPKRVELTGYNDIPHLLAPVIVDAEKTLQALKWALEEMDVRYRLLEDSGARNLMSFNINNPTEAKPFIVIVIDELADLMVKHGREIEGPIVRLSQMARAVGIHLVLATQRPSVNVLTGLIKANIPARLAFSVASQVDSRTIIDMAGAEKLVGNGDMLYLAGDKARPIRIQGGFVSEEEVRRVADAVRKTGEAEYDAAVTSGTRAAGGGPGVSGEADDPLYEEAKKLVMQSGKASASLLQRRLRVGYARAARLLDMLEDNGVIGEAEGNKPREILMEPESVGVAVQEGEIEPVGEGKQAQDEEGKDQKW